MASRVALYVLHVDLPLKMRVASVVTSTAPESSAAPTAAADADASQEPVVSQAPPLPAEPELLTAHGCGFGAPGRIDELEARWAAMLWSHELPLEAASRDHSFAPDAIVTAAEIAALYATQGSNHPEVADFAREHSPHATAHPVHPGRPAAHAWQAAPCTVRCCTPRSCGAWASRRRPQGCTAGAHPKRKRGRNP